MAATLHLEGAITFSTVLDRMGELSPYFTAHRPEGLEVSFSQISEVDSTAIPLMLHWLRMAQTLRIPLQFSGFPVRLARLLEVYHLATLIKSVYVE